MDAKRHHHPRPLIVSWLWLILFTSTMGLFATTPLGLPLSRFHSLDEIGGINGDFEINFDPVGRLTVVQNGSYSVLNDRDWLYLTEFEDSTEVLQSVLHLSEQEAYYGASGSWGKLVRTREGTYTPQSLVGEDRPSWSNSTNYLILFEFDDKICFSNWNGVVVWDKKTGANSYFEVIELADAFAIADQLYVTSALDGLKRVDFETNTLLPIPSPSLEEQLIYHHTPYDETRMLCATRYYGISLFDGTTLTPWHNDLDVFTDPLITSICRLPEGNFAVSFEGEGLFILNPEGSVISAYTTTEFRSIERIISREPGILWFSTDTGIQQVFYGSRVTIVDRRQGVHINWPQIVSWRGKTIVASNGRLYQSNPRNPHKQYTLI